VAPLALSVSLGCREFTWPSSSNPSDDAIDFVDRLLDLDESRRMTASEALDHPFIDKVIQGTIKTKQKQKLAPLLYPLEQMSR